MAELHLTPGPILEEIKKNDVTHIVWLPDSETSFLFERIMAEPSIQVVAVCREGESMAVAAGLWVGGKKPVVLIQNTGMFESGDAIRGLALDVSFPMLMMVGYRGWNRHGVVTDSAAAFTEPILHAWGIEYFLVETDGDVGRISTAFDEAERTQKPVACLMGAEYGETAPPTLLGAAAARAGAALA